MNVAAREPATPANGVPVAPAGADWRDACAISDVPIGRGVCALFGARQIAIFRPGPAEEIFALDNFDPFSKASVLSRGIVGDRAGVLKVASPIFKQNFDLRTGACLDDATVRVTAYPARVRDGRVEVLVPAGAVAS